MAFNSVTGFVSVDLKNLVTLLSTRSMARHPDVIWWLLRYGRGFKSGYSYSECGCYFKRH